MADGRGMGQQSDALHLRQPGSRVRDVQRQQVFLSEERLGRRYRSCQCQRHHGRHPRRREPPALSRVRIMLGGFIAANFCAFPAMFVSIAAGVVVDYIFYALKDHCLKAYRKKGKT